MLRMLGESQESERSKEICFAKNGGFLYSSCLIIFEKPLELEVISGLGWGCFFFGQKPVNGSNCHENLKDIA